MSTSDVFSRVSRIKILFVEADADTRLAYQSLAASEGFGVELAADAREAIALANVLLPDVVVLGLRLRDLESLDVVRRLRASSRTRAIPIVVISTGSTDKGDAAVHATGCDGHLVRPFSADTLLRLVSVLAIRRPDRCGLTTPRMETASDDAAEQILRGAGWRTLEPKITYCPRCSGMSPGAFARTRRRGVPSAIVVR